MSGDVLKNAAHRWRAPVGQWRTTPVFLWTMLCPYFVALGAMVNAADGIGAVSAFFCAALLITTNAFYVDTMRDYYAVAAVAGRALDGAHIRIALEGTIRAN